MEAATVLLHPSANLFSFPQLNKMIPSLRHLNKHLPSDPPIKPFRGIKTSPDSCFTVRAMPQFLTRPSIHSLHCVKCSNSNVSSTQFDNALLKPFRRLSFGSVRDGLSQLTPIDVCKWSAIISICILAAKRTVKTLLSPFFWTYFSWTWLFWPWFVAIGLAIYGLYGLQKHLRGEASVVEQLAIVTSAITWLTLVPPAYFSGFLEGWPFVFFLVYHYFFFFNVTVRKRLYGDYYPRPHDPKWDVRIPSWCRLLFCGGVMVGHWLAGFEGPELHLIPGGWPNLGIWVLILMVLLMQYDATLYLANYSEKIVVPTAVVQFGPYRWVRHPIYSSTMLLFMTYCIALRAPISALSMVLVCLLYYELKAKVEEALMVETFGEAYAEYARKVRYKFIPFVY